MRKPKRFTAILLMMAVMLGGCGSQGVSQEEYDQLSAGNSTLKEEIVSLKSENKKQKEEISGLKSDNEKQKEEISGLKSENERISEEYKALQELMKKYENVFQYADEITDYGNLKSEIERMQEEKTNIETDVQELQAQWQELEQKIENAKNPKPTSDCLVYSDNKVEIYFSEITNKGVAFEVKNLTDINLTFQADSVAVNGISTNKIVMSDSVAPQSVGIIVAKCSEFNISDDVYTVSGQLRIIDFSHSMKTYNAKFVNVEIQ